MFCVRSTQFYELKTIFISISTLDYALQLKSQQPGLEEGLKQLLALRIIPPVTSNKQIFLKAIKTPDNMNFENVFQTCP